MKNNIVFISSNDGSDMRINKEVYSLAKENKVIFLGIGNSANCFINDVNVEVIIIPKSRKSVFSYIIMWGHLLRIIFNNKIHSIHVINEVLLLVFWPLLIFKHTVLDIFDSIFLILNVNPDEKIFLKKMVYWPANKIIVTDENRRALMPTFLQSKIAVLPNYPNRYTGDTNKKRSEDKLVLLFFGWLGMARGGSIVKNLLDVNENVYIIMAGWFSDEECKALKNHPRVDYRGVVPQQKALEFAAVESDYILCLYEPINLNNINASPNKIYDAIQTRTPVIINEEIKVSSLVKDLNIGVVLPSYYPNDYKQLCEMLLLKRNMFLFPEDIVREFTWECIDHNLLNAHNG